MIHELKYLPFKRFSGKGGGGIVFIGLKQLNFL